MSLLLDGLVDNRDDTIARLRAELDEMNEGLRREIQKVRQIEAGVKELRTVLNPLYQALRHIFGEIDAMGVSEGAGTQVNSRVSAAWDQWKQKLGGQPAKAIDILMVHGAVTQTQLRVLIGCANGSIAGIVCVLNKAGLINKNGGKISLKEL